MYGPSKNGQWYYFENYCASKLVLDDPTRCGLFYKLVKSIWIIAFGSKTGSNEHGNVPFSDFRFKLEIDSIRKKSNYRSRDRIGLKLSCLTPLSRHLNYCN